MGLKKKCKRENVDKRRQTLQETTDNIEKIEKYLSSKVRENLLRRVANFQSATTIIKQEYYNYRAVLIGEIVFRSAQRSGVVSGMRKNEVITALEQDSQGKIVVFEHKTGKLRPGVVFLESLATVAFRNYLQVILPQIDRSTDSNGPFIISYNGKKIDHAGIQSSLNTLISLTGRMRKKRITYKHKQEKDDFKLRVCVCVCVCFEN